jgi:Integrase core domain/Chromo (CHRromatin Organisation MOdifier) domain
MSELLQSTYYDVKNPGGFTSASNLKRVLKNRVHPKDISEWLKQQETYTLHFPVVNRFQRNYYKVSSIDDTWQADLCDMRFIRDENDSYNYILTVIDILSKYAWGIPLKEKSATNVRAAFQKIFKEGRKPSHIMTDKGKEFVNSTVKNYLIKREVHFYTTNNPQIKASVVERFNRSLKQRMWRYFTHVGNKRYINVLDDLLLAYNNTYHSAIKMAPSEVTKARESEAFLNLYRSKRVQNWKTPKLALGTHVRISKEKAIFEKGYEFGWTKEIFKIVEILRREQVVYELEDLNGEAIEGTFYERELLPVKLPQTFKIDKIIRKKGKGNSLQYYVSWSGYPSKFDSWIKASDLA